MFQLRRDLGIVPSTLDDALAQIPSWLKPSYTSQTPFQASILDNQVQILALTFQEDDFGRLLVECTGIEVERTAYANVSYTKVFLFWHRPYSYRFLFRIPISTSCRVSLLNELVSWLNKFLVQVLVGCLLACCLVVILAWSRISDTVFFWVFFGTLDLVIITGMGLLLAREEIAEMYSHGTTGWKRTA